MTLNRPTKSFEYENIFSGDFHVNAGEIVWDFPVSSTNLVRLFLGKLWDASCYHYLFRVVLYRLPGLLVRGPPEAGIDRRNLSTLAKKPMFEIGALKPTELPRLGIV